MWKGFKVIDADAHMMNRVLLARTSKPSTATECRSRVMDGIRMCLLTDGKMHQCRAAAMLSKVRSGDGTKYGESYRTWWSAETRLKVMDQNGWDIQVCLPTANNGNFAYRVALKDVELGAAMCRAYNDWCYDYCSADHKRLKFVAVLPGGDPGELVKEARRAVEKFAVVG